VSKELIIHVKQHEEAIALLDNKRLVELNHQRSDVKFAVGDIYLGRVRKIMAGLNAAFIDVGYEKDAFLHYLDLGPQIKSFIKLTDFILKKGKSPFFQNFNGQPDIDKNGKITDVLKEGQIIMVQIAKEPIAKKGPRLSSEISIAGRNVVLLPFSDKISVSQKIQSIDERKRLKSLIKSIKPHNYGVIVRTAAESKKLSTLDDEIRELAQKWENTLNGIKNIKVPFLALSELSRASSIMRDTLTEDFNQIIVDDEKIYEELRDYINEIAPESKKIVKHYNGKTPIFDYFGINKQIKSLFGRVVLFKSGAYLIVEHTEALHVIDVNSGNRSEPGSNQEQNALEINLSAAEEISRQLKLRDMGGIIVVDFIDMQLAENRHKIYERMKDLMLEDKAKHNILPLSKFGLMQITRQRVRPETTIATMEKCPTCRGTGEISPSILFIDEIENKLAQLIGEQKLKYVHLTVHPFIESYLTKGLLSSIRRSWVKKYKINLKVTSDSSFTFFQNQFLDIHGSDLTRVSTEDDIEE